MPACNSEGVAPAVAKSSLPTASETMAAGVWSASSTRACEGSGRARGAEPPIGPRLQGGLGSFRGDPPDGSCIASLQGHAALERVRSQKRQVGAQRVFADGVESARHAGRHRLLVLCESGNAEPSNTCKNEE